MARWTLDDIPWSKFDRAKVDPDTVKIIKAAALVEYNGGTYARYLRKIFRGDPGLQHDFNGWAEEEIQHGSALARWARLADPDFDFQASFARFIEGYQQLPEHADASARGSCTGELVARCFVEIGTSSYYSALRDSTDEPVLKAICTRIAQDEVRHYNMFYVNMRRYLERERVGLWRRFRVGLGRLVECEDDELAYAYHAANAGAEPYDRKASAQAYSYRAYAHYGVDHVKGGMAMAFKAVGFNHRGWLPVALAHLAHRLMQNRARRLVA